MNISGTPKTKVLTCTLDILSYKNKECQQIFYITSVLQFTYSGATSEHFNQRIPKVFFLLEMFFSVFLLQNCVISIFLI